MPNPTITNCSNCGVQITRRWPCKSGNSFCSRICDGAYRRSHREKALKPGDQRGRLTLKVRRWLFTFQKAEWLCVCSCGIEKWIAESGLLAKPPHSTRSCGCLSRETLRNHTHGLSHHPLYRTHKNMIARCENVNDSEFKNYGARGIRVCEQWHDVCVFITDIEREIGAKPSRSITLDRINTDGNYEPDNVRWADAHTQQANKRATKLYEFQGKLVTMSHMSQLSGIDKSIFYRNRDRCQCEIDAALKESQRTDLIEGERLGILVWELDWTSERDRINEVIGESR